jgi:hypothetical protein
VPQQIVEAPLVLTHPTATWPWRCESGQGIIPPTQILRPQRTGRVRVLCEQIGHVTQHVLWQVGQKCPTGSVAGSGDVSPILFSATSSLLWPSVSAYVLVAQLPRQDIR